jgi:hypothetical protein
VQEICPERDGSCVGIVPTATTVAGQAGPSGPMHHA